MKIWKFEIIFFTDASLEIFQNLQKSDFRQHFKGGASFLFELVFVMNGYHMDFALLYEAWLSYETLSILESEILHTDNHRIAIYYACTILLEISGTEINLKIL